MYGRGFLTGHFKARKFTILKMIVLCCGARWTATDGTDRCPERRAREVIDRLALTRDDQIVGIYNERGRDGMHPCNRPQFGEYARVGECDETFRTAAYCRLKALSSGGEAAASGDANMPPRSEGGTGASARKRRLEEVAQEEREEEQERG